MAHTTETDKTLEAIDARKSETKAVREARIAIPLDEAVLCLSCEVVYSGLACPKCGDRFGWLLERWLSRRAA